MGPILSVTLLIAAELVGAGPQSESDRQEHVARSQQQAAQTILMFGGGVRFEDGSICEYRTPLAVHRAKSVTLVSIAEEEIMIGAPQDLNVETCLTQLKCFPKLRFLSLANNDIDDAMLKHLKGLPQLQEAHIDHRSKVTEQGVKAFQQTFPKCKVTR